MLIGAYSLCPCPAEPAWIYPAFANSVDPDQLASELFVIKYVNLYQQPLSSNLIDLNLHGFPFSI